MKQQTIKVFHFFEFILIIGFILEFLLASPKTLTFLADKITNNTGLTYKNITGNLLTNIHIKELSYKKKLIAKRADIDFNLIKLLVGKVEVDKLSISKININNFRYFIKNLDTNSSTSSNSSKISLALSLHNVKLDFLPYKVGKYDIKKLVLDLGDISSSDGKTIDAKDLKFNILTNMWRLDSLGYVKKNVFYANSKVWLNEKYFKKFIPEMDFKSLNPVSVNLKIDKDRLVGDIHTKSKQLFLKELKKLDIKVKELNTHAEFIFKGLNLHIKSKIKASTACIHLFNSNYWHCSVT